MKSANRTLVKSPPELWELLDQPERMQGLMSALLGRATEIKVTRREPEACLGWEARDGSDAAWIEVELAESGWGTNVEVKAENTAEPTKLEGWLDAVLDELATPQKRPFEGMTERPSGTVVDAMVAKPAPAEKPAAEPTPEPVAEEKPAPVTEPSAPEAPVEKVRPAASPKRDERGLLRKIFGI